MNEIGPGLALPLLALVIGAAAVLRGPIGQALARRLESRSVDQALGEELAELRARVSASEQIQSRVQELEERLDFAERVLAQRREAERLPGAP